MSAFFPGQRVKLVRTERGERAAEYGLQGTVRSVYAPRDTWCYEERTKERWMGRVDCEVLWDDSPAVHSQNTNQLEPLLPPYEKGDWEVIEQWLPDMRGVLS